jgi:hypothetical protein
MYISSQLALHMLILSSDLQLDHLRDPALSSSIHHYFSNKVI